MWYIPERILFINKNNATCIHVTTQMNLKKNHTKEKKPVTTDHIIYDPMYMTCPE